jgi:hypothetical protein
MRTHNPSCVGQIHVRRTSLLAVIRMTTAQLRKITGQVTRAGHGYGLPRARAWVGKFLPVQNPRPRARVDKPVWVFFSSSHCDMLPSTPAGTSASQPSGPFPSDPSSVVHARHSHSPCARLPLPLKFLKLAHLAVTDSSVLTPVSRSGQTSPHHHVVHRCQLPDESHMNATCSAAL